MSLNLIFARAANGVIGRDNALPWHLPEDLAHFKRSTLGCPVIMGRKTWDSLPVKFRPLPGRLNIVVTRQAGWRPTPDDAAVKVTHSIDEAHKLCASDATVWVIGGAELYLAALPLADQVVVTEIEQAFEGDAFAPTLGPEWKADPSEAQVSASGLRYRFVTYRRSGANDASH